MERPPNLDEVEELIRVKTLNRERIVLAVIEQILDQYISGFKELGNAKVTHYGREQAWSALTLQAFKSLRWAYHLLVRGYYAQANTLIRATYKDWLVCMDSIEHPETVEAVLYGKGSVASFRTMADRLPISLKNEWGIKKDEGLYGFLSTFAHPRQRLVTETIDLASGSFRVTPSFRENYFVNSSYYLLQGAVRMAEFLAKLVSPVSPSRTQQISSVREQANKCLAGLLAIAQRMSEGDDRART